MLTALLLSFLLTAPGDAIYVVAVPPFLADAPTKEALGASVGEGFPGVKPIDLDRYACFSDPQVKYPAIFNLAALATTLKWTCSAHDGNPVFTDEEALDLMINTAGKCRLHKKADNSGDVLICSNAKPGSAGGMSAAGKILNGALTQAALSKVSNLVWSFAFERSDPLDSTVISVLAFVVKIAPSATWRADTDARLVVVDIGKVAP